MRIALGLLGIAIGLFALTYLLGIGRRRQLASQLVELTGDAVARLGAESTFVEVNGHRFHVVVAGPIDGPLAVLLHGFPECWYSWRHQLPMLVKLGYRVIAPDQRGYGLSDQPSGMKSYRFGYLTSDVRALIEHYGRERAMIVAHDWGGAVAWRFAMDHESFVESLVIMDAPHPVAFARELKSNFGQLLRVWYMAFFQTPLLPELFLTLSPLLTARFFFRTEAFRKDAFTDDDLQLMASNLAQPGAMTKMIDWYRAAAWYPPKQPNQVIERPTLLLWAENDVALGKGMTEGLEAWVPQMERQFVPRCGHWVQNEAPDEVNAAIEAFVVKRRGAS